MASSLQGLLKSTPVPGLEGREGIINEYSMYNYYCVLLRWSSLQLASYRILDVVNNNNTMFNIMHSCYCVLHATDHVMFIAFLTP